jgi:PhoH-like ATPase
LNDIRGKWLSEKGITLDKYKDPHQYDYAQALFNEKVEAIFCQGRAGTGKTSLASFAGVYQVEKGTYDRLIYIRSSHVVGGRELGYLEGSLANKQAPYMKPILEVLETCKIGADNWIRFNKLVMTTPTYERGVNYDNSFIIVDEVQNLEKIELQTILTRIKQGSKVILTGSLAQNDNAKNVIKGKTPFEWYIEHFAEYTPKVQSCTLLKGYRGWFADVADRIDETINKEER